METYSRSSENCAPKYRGMKKADDFEISKVFGIGRLHFGCQLSDESDERWKLKDEAAAGANWEEPYLSK